MAKRTTITISEPIYQRALAVMEARAFDDFSGYIQALIREEYERRNGPATIAQDAPLSAAAAAAAAVVHTAVATAGKPVSYAAKAGRAKSRKSPQS